MSTKLEKTPQDEFVELLALLPTTRSPKKLLEDLIERLEEIDLDAFTALQKKNIKKIERVFLGGLTGPKKTIDQIRDYIELINDALNITLEKQKKPEYVIPRVEIPIQTTITGPGILDMAPNDVLSLITKEAEKQGSIGAWMSASSRIKKLANPAGDFEAFLNFPPEIQNQIFSQIDDASFRNLYSASKYVSTRMKENMDRKPALSKLRERYLVDTKEFRNALQTPFKRDQFRRRFKNMVKQNRSIMPSYQERYDELKFLAKRLDNVKRRFINENYHGNKFPALIARMERIIGSRIDVYIESEDLFNRLLDNQEFMDLLDQYEFKANLYRNY